MFLGMRSSKPVTVTLGPQQASVDARLKSGEYASASEILRAGIRALDREEAALTDYLRLEVAAALADPEPSIPAEEVFRELRAHHQKQLKARKRGP
jgi:antitoxin ParD1/3/4